MKCIADKLYAQVNRPVRTHINLMLINMRPRDVGRERWREGGKEGDREGDSEKIREEGTDNTDSA